MNFQDARNTCFIGAVVCLQLALDQQEDDNDHKIEWEEVKATKAPLPCHEARSTGVDHTPKMELQPVRGVSPNKPCMPKPDGQFEYDFGYLYHEEGVAGQD